MLPTNLLSQNLKRDHNQRPCQQCNGITITTVSVIIIMIAIAVLNIYSILLAEHKGGRGSIPLSFAPSEPPFFALPSFFAPNNGHPMSHPLSRCVRPFSHSIWSARMHNEVLHGKGKCKKKIISTLYGSGTTLLSQHSVSRNMQM